MIDSKRNIFLTEPVGEGQTGLRLDKYLYSVTQNLEGMSRSRLQNLIKDGYVTADDECSVVDCARKVRLGDSFRIEIPPADEPEPQAENIELDVIYEDDDLIVVNKPAGMTVHPAPGAYCGTLVNALLYHCRDNLSGIGGVKRPGIVHRIDKDTSGLLVVAKNDLAHQKLSEQFFEHSIERMYTAFVYSLPNPLSGTIDAAIGRSRFDRKKMAVLENGGKRAVTHYQTVEAFGTYASMVQCRLETGRTHQIRVHLSSIGCHLIGDQVYEPKRRTSLKAPVQIKELINRFPRQALHAKTLGFVHPRTGQKMSFSSELPEDLSELWQKLHNG
jgi:23S rRNA pseudouridine1911/1915/1917 synthase